MSSRERVLNALQHKVADRIPIDLGGAGATGISAFAYNNLRKRLGLPVGKVRIYDLEQMLALVETDVLKKIGGDIVYLTLPKFPGHGGATWKEWILSDGTIAEVPEDFNPIKNQRGEYELFQGGQVVAKMPDGGHYFDSTYLPLAEMECEKDLASVTFGLISNEELDILEQMAKTIRSETDFAIMFHCGGSIYNKGQFLRGFDNFMVDLLINKAFAYALIEKIVEQRVENTNKCLKRLGKYVDIIECSDDLGMQGSLQISPDTYREMIKPAHKKLFETIKSYGKYVFLHSCGAISELIPDLIDAGVDALNPIQLSAKGMDIAKLKKEFGKDITFWGGGCDSQYTLPKGTPEQVMEEVKRNVEILGRGGGFVFNQVHNIQYDVPVDNIIAMYCALGIEL